MAEPRGFDHDIEKMLDDGNISLMAITLQECRKQLGEYRGRQQLASAQRFWLPASHVRFLSDLVRFTFSNRHTLATLEPPLLT